MLSATSLLLPSAVLLELAAQSARALDRQQESVLAASDEPAPDHRRASEHVIGGGVFEGIRQVVRSPYLLGIAVFMLLFTITSTFLYFQQTAIVGTTLGDRQARTRLFANIDLAVNVLTLLTQLFVTGWALRWLGLAIGLAVVPILTLVGFSILGVAPVLTVVVLFQVLRRAGHFAVERPAREVLYTVSRGPRSTRPRTSTTRSCTASAIRSARGRTRRSARSASGSRGSRPRWCR
jgi:ATP:ADP antiporter, AAA family